MTIPAISTLATVPANERLAAMEPAAVEATLDQLLPSRANSWLKEVTVDRSTAQFGFDQEFKGYALVPGHAMTEDDEKQLAVCIGAHERALQPAPEREVLSELAALRVCTKSKDAGHDDLKFAQGIYARKLAEYPADVVLHVLRKWPNESRWWPAWEELHERIDALTRRRKKRLDALRRLASGDKPRAPEQLERRGSGPTNIGALMAGLREKLEADPVDTAPRRQTQNATASGDWRFGPDQGEDQKAAEALPASERSVFWQARMDGHDIDTALAMVLAKRTPCTEAEQSADGGAR